MSNPTRDALIEAISGIEWSNTRDECGEVADAVLALLAEPGALTAVAWRVEVPTTHNGMFALLYDNEDLARADYDAMPEAVISPLFAAASPVATAEALGEDALYDALVGEVSHEVWCKRETDQGATCNCIAGSILEAAGRYVAAAASPEATCDLTVADEDGTVGPCELAAGHDGTHWTPDAEWASPATPTEES